MAYIRVAEEVNSRRTLQQLQDFFMLFEPGGLIVFTPKQQHRFVHAPEYRFDIARVVSLEAIKLGFVDYVNSRTQMLITPGFGA